jgi:hypothetical protein
MIAGWLGAIPLAAILGLAGIELPLSALPAMLAAGVGGIRAYRFRCPRCRQSFVWSWGWQNVFTDQCVHCEYPISGPKPPPLPLPESIAGRGDRPVP